MNHEGLAQFLGELQDDGGLSEFELEGISQMGLDDDGSMLFSVTISYKRLHYVLTSYIPPAMVRRDIEQLAHEIAPIN